MLRKNVVWILFSMFMVINSEGCAILVNKTVSARLYNVQDGSVANAKFHFTGTTHGSAEITLPSGEVLVGEYNTVTGGMSGWGEIYGELWSLSVLPYEYVGTAIASSDQGTVMECEYITNRSLWNPRGHGTCRDNRGQIYKLMFGEK